MRSLPNLGSLVLFVVLAPAPAAALEPRTPDGGGGRDAAAWADAISPQLEAKLASEIEANVERLRASGKLPAPDHAKVAGLIWPLAPNPGNGLDWHGVSNFVDLDPAFPNRLRDYSCGARTYDNAQGYNHRGTDLFTWPFGWTLLDQGAIDIVAAAPGTIVAKADGNPDRSCSFDAADAPNYVAVQHADGTLARYLHMKTGSITPRPIGSAVVAGEYLGKVGSSGISTGPHLHFELRTSAAGSAATLDPFNGACNASASAWAAQRAYEDSRINRLATHAAAPALPDCPSTTDTPNLADRFDPGTSVIVAAYYRDQRRGQVTSFQVRRPDGSSFASWSFDMAQVAGTPQFYAASYWYWTVSLPADAPLGNWTFESTLLGQTRQHAFRVGPATSAIADRRGLTGAWYEPATSGQGFEFHWIEPDRLLVFFYGHHDDGRNLFLVGTRDGGFDYGETITVPLVVTSGGRFNGLDPDAIQRTPWGSVNLRFDDCESAVAELTGVDGTQQLELERLTRAPGLACD